jgi:intein/homing endonuclease
MALAPGKQATTQETSRVLTRGQLEFFNWKFFYDEAETNPIQPLDMQSYPSYRIIDPSGAVVAQGVAVPAGSPGHWKVGWVVPKTAQLTNPHKRYQLATVMVDQEMRQWELSWEFEVVESAITAQEPELQQFMTFLNTPLRLVFKNTVRPDSLQVKLFPKGQDNSPLFTAGFTYPVPDPAGTTDVQEFSDDTGFTYYVDTPPIVRAGSFSALWQVRDTPISQQGFEHQVVQVITTKVAHQINSLRMLIDKLQKKLGLAFAYSDEDMLEYLQEGTKLINSYWPPSEFNVASAPDSIEAFIILGGAWWGLTAQRVLYAETNLSFCVDLDTLLPTPKGLVRARTLVEDASLSMRQRISTQLVHDDDEVAMLEAICSNFGEGTRSIEMIEALDLGRCPISLGGVFARFTLSRFRSFNSLGNPVWDVPSFRKYLRNTYGMFHVQEEGCYDNMTTPLLTPYGYEVPECAWLLKQKQVYRMENELGYDVIATGNHPVLTLDIDTFDMIWKNMEDIEAGDLVALDTAPNEEEEDWEVSLEEYVNIVRETNTCKTQSIYDLPDKMTPELAKICGYLVSEGCLTQYERVGFSNTSKDIIEDFNRCCKSAFGKEATLERVDENPHSTYRVEGKRKTIYRYLLTSVELRRYLFALGLGYEKSQGKTIPESILRSPKKIVREFLQGFIEGDGCFAEDILIFSSASNQLLVDIQQLLLRFGIVSKKVLPKKSNLWVGNVTVRGPSLVRYAEEIGFLFKGKDFKPKSVYYPQREALNPEILHGLVGIRKLLGLNIKGWKDTSEGKKRYCVYWDHNAKLAQHITWDHVDNWFADRGQTIKELNSDVWDRLNLLMETRYLWKKVVTLEKLDRRDVVDPSFAPKGNYLDHAFITNGMVTHNSGQTVTLDYNPGADIDSIISTFKETLDNSVSKAKQQILRNSSGVGAISTRPYRYRTNVVFPISSGPGLTSFIRLQQLGLMDWLG